MKKLLLASSILLCSLYPLSAQDDSNAEEEKEGEEGNAETKSKDTREFFWEARLAGGNYLVDIKRIISISKHRYLVSGLEVIEVVIDTDGNALARFYTYKIVGEDSNLNIAKNTTNRAKELLRDQGKRAGISDNPVTKTYPQTTHAKTIEYLLADEATLNSLMKSVRRAWTLKKGGKFTAK